MPVSVERVVASGAGAAGIPTQAQLSGWADRTVDALPAGHLPAGQVSCVTVRVVGADESARLNAEWRGRDRPTNVLAFPAAGVAWPPDEPRPLGDIVICADVVASEAAQQGKAPTAHWCHMLVHGLLHLLGFDHADDEGAEVMEALEQRVLAGIGMPDPYAAPAGPV